MRLAQSLRLTTTILAASARVRMASARARESMARAVVTISDAFDAGNIRFLGNDSCQEENDSQHTVQLQIKPDPFTELEKKQHMQWFAFRAMRARPTEEGDLTVTYEIVNAGDCSFAEAWEGAEIVASHDRATWMRVASTRYDPERGILSWKWTHSAHERERSVFFAYFDLYPYDRHLQLIDQAAASGAPGLMVDSLGQTLQGREIECVRVGTGRLQAWVIHRQHPGESMAEFYAEGLLNRLLGLYTDGAVDGVAQRLLRQFTFHVVPSMNPDGAALGHLRVNAGGANLNREWASTGDYEAPTLARSPEVYHVLQAMDQTGVDFFADVHGDEALPFAFCAGGEGLQVWGPRLQALHGAFVAAYGRANPDMQAPFGYEPDAPLGANYAICSNQISQRFDCLGLTLEMPFKDSAAVPRAPGQSHGFDGRRAMMLGASLVDALSHVAPQLRGIELPHFPLAEDSYVAPTEDADAIRRWIQERAVHQ